MFPKGGDAMRPTLVTLLTAAAALPFLASCSATVAPDGYGYYDTAPAYYGPSYGPGYYYHPYPRYHEYHPIYRHAYDRHAVVRHGDDHAEVHGRIAIEH
jgi:hypothetical protein